MLRGLTEPGISYPQDVLLEIGLALARFTRNLAAGVPNNQEKILQDFVISRFLVTDTDERLHSEIENSLRLLLHYLSSYFRGLEEESW